MEGYAVFLFLLYLTLANAQNNLETSLATVRLAGTTSNAYGGRVEIFHNGEWGTVCDKGWGWRDAQVVCKQLGYLQGAHSTLIRFFGPGTGRIWLSNVNCRGNEDRITDCKADPIGTNECDHGDDVGVICTGSRAEIRLADQGPGGRGGRVEIFHQGVWGTVCGGADWGMKDADVVCRQVGYPDGAYGYRPGALQFGQGVGKIWLAGVRCVGTEAKITDCPANLSGINKCQHSNDAGVICSGSRTGKREEDDYEFYYRREELDDDEVSQKKEFISALADLLAKLEDK